VQTIADLKQRADSALYAERFVEALHLYAAIVELQPGNLDARLRVADTLLALGEVQPAAVVYTALARASALAGYPLRALVALKMLTGLEPKLGVLMQEIARLYGRESYRVGQGVRRTLPTQDAPVDELILRNVPSERTALVRYAQQLAERYQSDAVFFPERLLPIPLLSLLPEREFSATLELLRIARVRPDTWLLRQGESGSSFFVLVRGSVDVTTERAGEALKLARLSEGSVFGEMVLLADTPRTASVRTVTDCDLLEFDRESLKTASTTLEHLGPALHGFARDRLLSNVTLTSPLFRPFDARQRLDLMRRFINVEVAANQPIIQQGQEGQGLYVVLRGAVDVTRGAQRIAQLGPSELFGEISVLRREPTSATVSGSVHGASLLFLHRNYFERLIDAVPEIRDYLESLSETRLKELRAHTPEPELGTGDEIDVELLF
jgi:CRP-like cAMP-binding protein